MDKPLELLIKNIKRYAPNLTNYQISKLSGVSESSLSAYFTGQRIPSIEIVFKLANGLKIHPYQLLMDEEEKNIPADIMGLLEDQPESVYESIRTILKTFNSVKKEDKKKA